MSDINRLTSLWCRGFRWVFPERKSLSTSSWLLILIKSIWASLISSTRSLRSILSAFSSMLWSVSWLSDSENILAWTVSRSFALCVSGDRRRNLVASCSSSPVDAVQKIATGYPCITTLFVLFPHFPVLSVIFDIITFSSWDRIGLSRERRSVRGWSIKMIILLLSRMCIWFFSLSYSPLSWKNAVCETYWSFIRLSSGKSFAISRGIYDFPEEDGALSKILNWDSSVYAESIARNTMSLFISSCFIVRESIRITSPHFMGENFVISVPWMSSLYWTISSSMFPPFAKYSDISFHFSSGREIR